MIGTVTYWDFQLLASEDWSGAYDSLAEHLVRGEATVDEASIGWEGIRVGDRVAIYFGPLPALLRIPVRVLWPGRDGMWGRLSVLTASLVSCIALSALFGRGLRKSNRMIAMARARDLIPVTLGVAFGSPVLFIASSANIYHEAIAWGLAGACSCLFFAVCLLEDEFTSSVHLVALSCASGMTFLARVTFGAPWLLFLAFCWADSALRWHSSSRTPQRVESRARRSLTHSPALLPALASVALYLWYNQARFGSPWTFVSYQGFYLDPASFHGTLDLARIPDALHNYFVPGREALKLHLPVLTPTVATYWLPDRFWSWREPTVALLLASPWLVFGGFLGVAGRLRAHPEKRELALLIALLSQWVVVLSYYFVTQRFSAELLPLLALGTYWFLRNDPPKRASFWTSRLMRNALIAGSILATLSSSLYWVANFNGGTPREARDRIRRVFTPRPFLPVWAGDAIFLDSLRPSREVFTHVEHRNRTTVSGTPMTVTGWPQDHGLGCHAIMTLEYGIPETAKAFHALLSISDDVLMETDPSVDVSFWNENDELLFRSRRLTPKSPTQPVIFTLGTSRHLRIEIGDGGNGISYDHVNLAMAAFLLPSGRSDLVGQAPPRPRTASEN